jgi:subtilisin family serine protease
MVGKLERELAELLPSRAATGDQLRVIYVLRSADGAPERGAQGDRLEALEASVAQASAPVAARLSQTGHQIIYRARYANIIVAAAPASGIRAMERDADVEGIYLERVSEPRLNASNVVVQANLVFNRGIRGAGIRAGVVEAGRIGSHINLPGGQRILCRPAATSMVSGHKTQVAGVIQSNNGTFRGMAPAITLVDGIGANFGDAEMMAATDCVIAQGTVAVNMSFGVDTNGFFNGLARYVDQTAHNTGRTIVVAVTNSCSQRMGSPKIAFNALAVGSYSDRNTVAGGDDRHSCNAVVSPQHSGFLDPFSPNNDREEPDLAGPGHLIRMPVPGGGFADNSGTSFAAPHLTGIAGLVRNRAGGSIQTQNERLRAILMASARKNIEGPSRLSERDGTGSVQAAAADRVLLNGQSFFFTRPGGTTGFPIIQSFSATAGERTRVVTVWSHKPSGSASTQPTTDLDLVVLRPGGAVVGSSLSFDNSYEIVEFTAPVTGSYQARINNFRSSAGAEFIGLAISRQNS